MFILLEGISILICSVLFGSTYVGKKRKPGDWSDDDDYNTDDDDDEDNSSGLRDVVQAEFRRRKRVINFSSTAPKL